MPDKYDGLQHYPFPLRPDQMAFFWLPVPLTREDAARLVAFLQSLVQAHEEPRCCSAVDPIVATERTEGPTRA